MVRTQVKERKTQTESQLQFLLRPNRINQLFGALEQQAIFREREGQRPDYVSEKCLYRGPDGETFELNGVRTSKKEKHGVDILSSPGESYELLERYQANSHDQGALNSFYVWLRNSELGEDDLCLYLSCKDGHIEGSLKGREFETIELTGDKNDIQLKGSKNNIEVCELVEHALLGLSDLVEK